MNNPKEFTQDEFDRFVEKNNLEVFTKAQVDAFSKDVIEKSKNKEIDEFEIACCTADYMSLKPVFVRSNDLMKSLMFYREAQREPVEIPDGIFKSIDDRMCFCYKETPLNILKGIAGINCADDIAIEKAKALPLGTEKMYGGKMYVKTEKGWRLKKKGTTGTGKESETKESKKEASNEKSVKQKTSSFLGDYDRALMENFRLKKELFNAEEESKYRSKNDSFYLPLEKLKKTEWYENQLNKIKESENKLSKIKAEKPEELDKDAIKSELKIMNDGQDWFENRVKSFREKGYDKSDDEKERNLWREATDDIKRREIYTQFVQSLLKD